MSLAGCVKSYNAGKQFGFIQSETGDVFFRAANMPDDCKMLHGNLLTGREVLYDATVHPEDGRSRATHVILKGTPGVPFEEEYHPGTIKSYNDQKGFGFIVSSMLEKGQEVMFGKKELASVPIEVRANLVQQLIIFKVQTGEDGRMKAVDVKVQTGGINQNRQNGAVKQVMMQQQVRMPTMPQHVPQMQSQVPMGSVTGSVKSYSERHGYGFISSPGMSDARFQTRDLDPSQMNLIQPGASVYFTPRSAPDGRIQAVTVRVAGQPGSMQVAMPSATVAPVGSLVPYQAGAVKRKLNDANFHAHTVAISPVGKQQKMTAAASTFEQVSPSVLAGTVKTFNPAKGFGFIVSEGSECAGDAFFMRSDVTSGLETLQPGQQVTFTLMQGSNGKYRAQSISTV